MNSIDAVFVLALCLVVAGVVLIYLPAGLVVAGGLMAVCAALYPERGEG